MNDSSDKRGRKEELGLFCYQGIAFESELGLVINVYCKL
jgi:hypothetical protein